MNGKKKSLWDPSFFSIHFQKLQYSEDSVNQQKQNPTAFSQDLLLLPE